MAVGVVSLQPSVTAITRRMYSSWAKDSSHTAKRVPTHPPSAPSARVLASVRPSAMPPEPSTITCFGTAALTSGTSSERWSGLPSWNPRMWPPPCLPWAMITSAPYSTASRAPATVPTCAHCLIPAAFSFLTQRASGFVQNQTTKSTFSSMRTSTWPSLIDQVDVAARTCSGRSS